MIFALFALFAMSCGLWNYEISRERFKKAFKHLKHFIVDK